VKGLFKTFDYFFNWVVYILIIDFSEVLYIYIIFFAQSQKVNPVLFGFKAFAYFFYITAPRRPQLCFLTVIPDAAGKVVNK